MWSTYALAILVVAGYTSAYRTGAPASACHDMIPRHPVGPQNSTAPYSITTSTNSLKAGNSLEVTITGHAAKDTMRGLLLEARLGDKIVGKFTVNSDDKFAQLLDCDAPGDAVTHKKHDPEFDQQTVTYVWTSPANLNGNIRFRATIAYSGPVFWVGVESPQVKVFA